MSNLITHCYVKVYDDGYVVTVDPTIYLTQPPIPINPCEYVHICQSVFLANRYIRDNTAADVKVKIAA